MRLGPCVLLLLAVLAGAVALPEPARAQTSPWDDEEGDAKSRSSTYGMIERALAGLLCPPSLIGDTAVFNYAFSPTSEREPVDWVWLRKPDRVSLASAAAVAEGVDGYDIGAGGAVWGKVVHKVELEPPCSIDIDFYCWYNGPSSSLLVTMGETRSGEGIAVDWGKQLARVRGKAVRATGGGAEPRESLKAGRDYVIHVEMKDGQLTASLNGLEGVRAALTEKDMTAGKLGFEIRDARIIIRSIRFSGKVSQAWAEKEAKKTGGR